MTRRDDIQTRRRHDLVVGSVGALVCLVICGCGAGARQDYGAQTTHVAPSATPSATPAPPGEQPPSQPGAHPGRCSLGCCSPQMLELQQATARRVGDPSIATECCFCDESPD